MGSGLACSQTGKHVAYTAGTGVLVFLDLVAYLVIRIADKHCGLGINTSHNAMAAGSNVTSGAPNQSNASMDNPYEQSRDGALKGNGGLNYSDRTKGFSQTSNSMYKSGDAS